MVPEEMIERLHTGNYACVIRNGNEERVCYQRGVADLYDLLKNQPDFLNHAQVADKVIGKGAAALMALGKVAEVYTDVISRPARALLERESMPVTYVTEAPYIRNRAQTGQCPVETLCSETDDLQEMLEKISCFLASLKEQG